jgi:hypothetical protein
LRAQAIVLSKKRVGYWLAVHGAELPHNHRALLAVEAWFDRETNHGKGASNGFKKTVALHQNIILS